MMVHCSSKKIFSEKVVHSCHDATGSTTEQALHRVLSCWTHHEAQMQSVSSQDAIPFFRIPLLWCYMSLTSSNALRIFNETNMPFPKKKAKRSLSIHAFHVHAWRGLLGHAAFSKMATAAQLDAMVKLSLHSSCASTSID